MIYYWRPEYPAENCVSPEAQKTVFIEQREVPTSLRSDGWGECDGTWLTDSKGVWGSKVIKARWQT